MRLGAWDYIDKGEKAESTIRALVETTILGLYERLRAVRRRHMNIQAHEYIKKHTDEIIRNHAGKFLALQQVEPDENLWHCIAEDGTLFGLYTELSDKEIGRDEVHITHVDGTGED